MNNITLIGMPACGKTTVGQILSKRLGYKFVDGDDLIIAKYGPLQPILDTKGDDYFMRLEEGIICNLSGSRQIFCPGGSVAMEPKAMEHLKKISLVVYIDVPFEIIKERLENSNIDTRGIVGLKKYGLKGLFDLRTQLYLKYQDLTVNVAEHPFHECADMIIKELKK